MEVLRVTAECPVCGAPPRVRISQQVAESARKAPPMTVILTYQCSWVTGRQRCDHIYAIRAGHVE